MADARLLFVFVASSVGCARHGLACRRNNPVLNEIGKLCGANFKDSIVSIQATRTPKKMQA